MDFLTPRWAWRVSRNCMYSRWFIFSDALCSRVRVYEFNQRSGTYSGVGQNPRPGWSKPQNPTPDPYPGSRGTAYTRGGSSSRTASAQRLGSRGLISVWGRIQGMVLNVQGLSPHPSPMSRGRGGGRGGGRNGMRICWFGTACTLCGSSFLTASARVLGLRGLISA